jgi:hypothetical protein
MATLHVTGDSLTDSLTLASGVEDSPSGKGKADALCTRDEGAEGVRWGRGSKRVGSQDDGWGGLALDPSHRELPPVSRVRCAIRLS